MKRLIILLLIITGCEDKPEIKTIEPEPEPRKGAYALTDPSLRHLFDEYLRRLKNISVGDPVLDTANIILSHLYNSDISTNKTKVYESGDTTYIEFHKEYFDKVIERAGGEDFRIMYLVHHIANRPWECVMFRELKTLSDIESYRIMLTWGGHTCTPILECCPIRYYLTDDPERIMCWSSGISDYWFDLRPNDFIDDKVYDVSNLEDYYRENGIPLCNN